MSTVSVPFVSFAQVRRGARVVAERAAHVGVVTQRIDELALEFDPAPRSTLPAGVRPEDSLAFLVVRAALRFGSGYEPKLTLTAGTTAAEQLEAALVARFSTAGPIATRDMVHATSAELSEFRGQGLAEPPQAEFVELQVRAARDLGRFLLERYQGSYERLLDHAQGSAARLCEALATMPFFHDSQRYRGMDVQFFHRAQQLVCDLVGSDLDPVRFEDVRELAPSSDAECALAFDAAGVITYDQQLSDRVTKGEIVPAHSEREVEIRAATLYAAQRLTATIRVTHPDITAVDVDRWLRARARELRRVGREPHRSRSVFY
jgi:hypothetical protein